MIYVCAIFFPPLALLLHRRVEAAPCLLFWLSDVVHAILIVSDDKAQQRQRELLATLHPDASPHAQFVPTVADPMPLFSRVAISVSIFVGGWMISAGKQNNEHIVSKRADTANTFPVAKTPVLVVNQRGAK